MKPEEYIKTIVVNSTMVNLGMDDYGQTYFLEYVKDGKLVEDCVGAYETDYMGYAEMLFEDPKNCDHYNHVGVTCKILDKTYCSQCPLSELVQARNERWLKTYGVPYPKFKEDK